MTQEQHICWGAACAHSTSHQLEIRNLSISYGDKLALDNLSMSCNCGHTLALIGPNGAGKSSLINAIVGIIPYQAGEIIWQGKPIKRNEIAYMPQRNEIDWSFPINVRQLVEMGRYPSLGLWKKVSQHDRDIVDKAISSLNLGQLQERQIGELSGGQQQRVFLARALAQEAHILLLDEPFNGLDLPGIQQLSQLLGQLAAEGRLVIASHHDLVSAPTIFEKTLLLKRELIAYGDTRDVLSEENIRLAYGDQPTIPQPS